MKKLIINKTEKTPAIILDSESNTYSIEGVSCSESVSEFYKPVIKWINEYYKERIDNPDNDSKIEFKINFKYINSTTFKYVIEILRKLSSFYDKGMPVNILWHYEDDDDDIMDTGNDLAEINNIKVPFKYIPVKK